MKEKQNCKKTLHFDETRDSGELLAGLRGGPEIRGMSEVFLG